MDFHWLDLLAWLQYFNIYFENSPPPPECLQMLIEAQQNEELQRQYINDTLEKFINENKCCISNN